MAKFDVKGTSIAVYSKGDKDFISLTDMLKANAGDFFIADWLRNCDEANAAQLACLANLEPLNAHSIHQGMAQVERLNLLNQPTILLIKLLQADVGTRRLEGK